MDKLLNSQKDKQTIYEIYRACRLCGAGAGYKMPIIQSVVDVDESELELKHKIRECVQIEVDQDDKMPPLICELCVDKVNDFYEFLDMCRQTNQKTRLRLGLPPQSMPSGASDAGDCILGLTEPVYLNRDEEPKKKGQSPKVKVNKELKALAVKSMRLSEKEKSRRYRARLKANPEKLAERKRKNRESYHRNKTLISNFNPEELKKKDVWHSETAAIEPIKQLPARTKPVKSKASNTKAQRSPIPTPPSPPTPPRVTRNKKDDDVALSQLQKQENPKSILKKERSVSSSLSDDSSLLVPRAKRGREIEIKFETPPKKLKIQPPKATSPKPKIKETKPKRSISPPKEYACSICDVTSKTSQGLVHHMKVHTVGYTNKKLSCNACCEWFPSAEEAATHHKLHRGKALPYNCKRCDTDFKTNQEYESHLESDCLPWEEVPDVKCYICWHMFATSTLLEDHNCLGVDHRPGGKCGRCKRTYALLKNLQKHEVTCTYRKKGELDPTLLAKLRPMQIRVAKCDPLLYNKIGEHYDVSTVSENFGLDPNCFYPYSSIPWRLKDNMVSINPDFDEYINWDSTSGSETEGSVDLIQNSQPKKKKIDSLAKMCLKTIYSKKFLGKVPKKRKRKLEKGIFDVILHNEDDYNVKTDIGNIINSLRDDEDINIGSAVSEETKELSETDNRLSEDNANNDSQNDSNEEKNEKDSEKNDTVDSIGESLDKSNNDNSITDYHNDNDNDKVSGTDSLSNNNESVNDINGVKNDENSKNFDDSINNSEDYDGTSVKKDNFGTNDIINNHFNSKTEENTNTQVQEDSKNTNSDDNFESKTNDFENSFREKSVINFAQNKDVDDKITENL